MEQISTLTETKPSKFWDTIDEIDRYLYGRKMKNFIIGSILVLAVAPLLDWFLEVPFNRLTFYSTLYFFLYSLLLVLCSLSAWRNEDGKFTWTYAFTCAKSRIKSIIKSLRKSANKTKTNEFAENLYKLSSTLILISVAWKSLQNLSVFTRKLMGLFLPLQFRGLRNFEATTNFWTPIIFFIGLSILFYLLYTNKDIFLRIKKDLIRFFGRDSNRSFGNFENLNLGAHELVLKSNYDSHLNPLLSNSKSEQFNTFVEALKTWKPTRKYRYECDYQNDLRVHLEDKLPEASIIQEYPIGSIETKDKGRADIVINHSILIEMKRDFSSASIQRANGQIVRYCNTWQGRGPVILLLCHHNYEDAKLQFNPTMTLLAQSNQPVLTLVAEN